MLATRVGMKWRPSNGTEGAVFQESWCANCQRDKWMNGSMDIEQCGDGDLCQIIGNAEAYDVDHRLYPDEWQYDKDGQPCCIAYVEADSQIPEPRCANTSDMFGDEP
jgi:hypothetical protein